MFWLYHLSPNVHTVWAGAWNPGFVEAWRYLYNHELVVVTRGRCQVRIEERVIDCVAPFFLVIPPGRRQMAAAGSAGVFRYCVHFDWVAARQHDQQPLWVYAPDRLVTALICQPPDFIPRDLSGRCISPREVVRCLKQLLTRWQSAATLERLTCGALLWDVLIRLLLPLARTTAETESHRQNRLALDIKAHLDRLENSDVSMQDYLHSFGCSYAHACRLFRRKFGLSPVRYRNLQRLEKARELLKDPRLNMAEVAYQLGFRDPRYFTRLFRKHTGLAPSVYAGQRHMATMVPGRCGAFAH